MPAATLPSHESRRLRSLRRLAVLDTLPETFSEAVSAAAASIANAPIAAISFIDDDRLWFKGVCGLPGGEAPRDVAFCAYTVLATDPLIVEDAQADPRFRDNPLVVGPPYIRFYAGFPIVVDGDTVGALCIIDDRPRTLSPAQIERLVELADGTTAWLLANRPGA